MRANHAKQLADNTAMAAAAAHQQRLLARQGTGLPAHLSGGAARPDLAAAYHQQLQQQQQQQVRYL